MKQFHYHAPSEHTINGRYGDLEVHVVTIDKSADPNSPSRITVFGFLFQIEPRYRENNFEDLIEVAEEANGEDVDVNPGFAYDELKALFSQLPKLGYYTYKGSLTTPPCSE